MQTHEKNKVEDYIGKKYGHLTVIGQAPRTNAHSNSFQFRCDCGNIIVAQPARILSGHKSSCGKCEYANRTLRPVADIESLIGQKKNMLTVIGIADKSPADKRWKIICRCECGNTATITPDQFNRGVIKSCGCLRCRPGSKADGKAKHPLYGTWNQMMGRCYRPKNIHYDRYGGRGIKVCQEWHDFWKFVRWSDSVGGRPRGAEIDRIDNDGDYCPENCRWVSRKQQMNNTSYNVKITYNGQTKTLKEWSEELEIPYTAICHRYQRGWSVERMLIEPVHSKKA